MPLYTLTVNMRQTLADTEVFTIEAPSLKAAKDLLEQHAGSEEPGAAMADGLPEDVAHRLCKMDPHEVVDGDTDIAPGDYTTGRFSTTDDGEVYSDTPGLTAEAAPDLSNNPEGV